MEGVLINTVQMAEQSTAPASPGAPGPAAPGPASPTTSEQ
jgi:hypothetical protein